MSPLFSAVCPKPLLRRSPGTGPEQGLAPNLTYAQEFTGFIEFKAEIYSSPINGNQQISSGCQSVLSRPQRLDI